MPKQNQQMTIPQALALGIAHQTEGRLPDAENVYQKILEQNPDEPIALQLLGTIAYQQGKYDTAIDLINKALILNPNYIEAYNNLGLALQRTGRIEDAIVSYRKALKLKTDFPDSHYNLGNALKETGELEEALKSYQKAVETRNEFSEAYANMGLVLHKLDNGTEAITSYRKAIAINPDFSEAHNNMGNVLRETGDLESAIISYRKAVETKPDFAEAYSNLGSAFQELNKLDAALTCFRQAIAIQSTLAEAHAGLGITLHALNRIQEAVVSYSEAIAINPDFVEAHNNLGNALHELGNTHDSIKHLWLAVSLKPDSGVFCCNLVAALEGTSFTSTTNSLYQNLLFLLKQPTVNTSHLVKPIYSALRHHKDVADLFAIGNLQGRTLEHTVNKLSDISLLLEILSTAPVLDIDLEKIFTDMRRQLLEDTIIGEVSTTGLPFTSALALQCFINEYVFCNTETESANVKKLCRQTENMLKQGEPPPSHFVTIIGSYLPLFRFDWAPHLFNYDWPADIERVLKIQITEPLEEKSLRDEITSVTPIKNDTSRSVRHQYEENPYPRWIKNTEAPRKGDIGHILNSSPLSLNLKDYTSPEFPNILIAGCGTGQEAFYLASRFTNSHIVAIDLSITSLSYAKRLSKKLNYPNLEFMHGDILELDRMERRFDLIACSGVLHHLDQPISGWKVLNDLLLPNGIMKVALYSKIARKHIDSAQSLISEKGYIASPNGIRQFRHDVINMAESGASDMAKLCQTKDFFNVSECRDLLFHVKEHRFTLPQLKLELKALNMEFIGFEIRDQRIVKQFKDQYSETNDLVNLSKWHQFELNHPDTFFEMYQMWCKKL